MTVTHDQPLSSIRYWTDDKGLVEGLEGYYPMLCEKDPVIRAAIAQIKVGEAALRARVHELDYGVDE